MKDDIRLWLEKNHIQFDDIDDEVIDIPEFGKVFVQDSDEVPSIFRPIRDSNDMEFNCVENSEVLMKEEIYYAAFRFGDNWYYTDLRKPMRLNILKYIGQKSPSVRKERYINLGAHTGYELLNGSGLPSDWLRKAKWMGMDTLGVCDMNTMASHFQLQTDASELGMRHIFGYSLTFKDNMGNKVGGKVYVKSQQGMRNLLRIQKAVAVDSEDQTVGIDELWRRGEGNVFVFGKLSADWMLDNIDTADRFFDHFDSVYFQVDLSEYLAERFDLPVLNNAKKYFTSELYDMFPPVLLTDCYYLDKDDCQNKIILNKTATGAAHEASDDQYFKDIDEQYEKFQQLFDPEKFDIDGLFAECCESTLEIAEGASAYYHTDKNFMPQYDMTEEEKVKYGTSHNMFIQLLEEGLERLVPEKKREQYRKQMEYEKYVIESTNNVDYLLVQWDCVNWCRRNDIFVGCGRGSAAGCLLLYLLGITLVDPMKYGLIFERFLLPERAGMYPADTTKIRPGRRSGEAVVIEFDDGKRLEVSPGSLLLVKREENEEPVTVSADELRPGDDIIFDNRDEIFTINELQ